MQVLPGGIRLMNMFSNQALIKSHMKPEPFQKVDGAYSIQQNTNILCKWGMVQRQLNMHFTSMNTQNSIILQ